MPEAGPKPEAGTSGGGEGRHRVLVIAAESLAGEDLGKEIERHAGGVDPEVRVVFPALPDSPLKQALGDVDEAIAEAERRLERELEEARRFGVDIEGTIGDADPIVAIEDALRVFPADEILIVTHSEDEAGWLEKDLFEDASERFELPLTHVVVGPGGRGAEETEHAGPRADEPREVGVEGYSRDTARLSVRDIGGIVMAIVGSIAAILIATDCPGSISEGAGTSTACLLETVIAGGITLINIAHVVALTLIEGLGHRGLAERFFALASLFGTPLAIAANLIIAATAS